MTKLDGAIAAPNVADVFASYPTELRHSLLELRRLVLDTAAETPGVGAVEETLRWGQPSFVTSETRSGSTIRIAPTSARSVHDYAVFFNCQTTLVETFKGLFGDVFSYEGNRALEFSVGANLPKPELRACIAMALTYHRR